MMNKSVNFEVTTDIAKIGSMQIEANYEAVKEYISEAMSGYKDLVVTEDSVPEAKKDRANIRKIKTRIDDYRKTIKAEWSAPIKAFEEKCKELTAICDEAADNLDAQIKGFEEKNKEEKIKELRAFFNRVAKKEGVDTYLAFEDVYNPKWENITYLTENAMADIQWAVSMASVGKQAVKATKKEFSYVGVQKGERRTTHKLEIKMTKNQAEVLRQFLSFQNIDYRPIKE